MVHEIVGRINGQYGTLTYVPIYHLDTSLSFTELCALYAVTDVALVTSLRDGMNLVRGAYCCTVPLCTALLLCRASRASLRDGGMTLALVRSECVRAA